MSLSYDIVIPTVGRESLRRLLAALRRQAEPLPSRMFVVDDRRAAGGPLPVGSTPVQVLRSAGVGPAGARNLGWRRSAAEWVVFLDDDVVPTERWSAELRGDLATLSPDVAGVQGRIEVALPEGRRLTDWERNVRGLERARWATADMAYRRSVLHRVGGFDERFRRAYREDADLALRTLARGYRLEQGRRVVRHPVGPADRWVSVRLQAGNADDVLMRSMHGGRWREKAGVPRGRRPVHVLITVAGSGALVGAAVGRRAFATVAAGGWLAGCAELAYRRIAPGPRGAGEILTMVVTSMLIPSAATFHWLRGLARHGLRSFPAPGPAVATALPARGGGAAASRPEGVMAGRQRGHW